jgi:ATP-binding cassette, subfamily C, bacterial
MPTTATADPATGRAELAAPLAPLRWTLWAAVVFSAFVNLLMLTAPLYMMQVYDRVLVSRSEETLVTLSLIAAFLFVLMGVFDHARGRIMARIGLRLQAALDRRVHTAVLARLAQCPGDSAALAAPRDLDAMARLWASPVLVALFDAPFVPVFLAAVFMFHPMLGWLAVIGGGVLVLCAWLNQRATDAWLARTTEASLAAEREAQAHWTSAELIQSQGMASAAFARWQEFRQTATAAGLAAADLGGRWTTVSRTFRLFLQSAVIGLAAWLVLREGLSAGAMLAASVLTGRALQPVEVAVSQWATVSRARKARDRLAALLSEVPPPVVRTPLPRPAAIVEVQDLSVRPSGSAAPVLRGLGFTLRPGQALGVIGPSGAGKSALARALAGLWVPATGQVRLDGATPAQHGPEGWGQAIGYLPQRVTLFDATIAQNIARLDHHAPPDRVIAAARAAAAHDLILLLPEGYDSRVGTAQASLSGGQLQRLGLARALYGDPALLILDEPNAHLDNEGAAALNHAVRAAKARGAAVVIMAHRPTALQECDLLLVLQEGAAAAFGPRDSVLRDAVRNAGDIARTLSAGAVG